MRVHSWLITPHLRPSLFRHDKGSFGSAGDRFSDRVAVDELDCVTKKGWFYCHAQGRDPRYGSEGRGEHGVLDVLAQAHLSSIVWLDRKRATSCFRLGTDEGGREAVMIS